MDNENAAQKSRNHADGGSAESAEEGINLLEYVYVLVKSRWLIIGLTFAGIFGGHLAARLFFAPLWTAEALIAPKETESAQTPNLTSLGAFSGLVASQFNIGGSASLEKIERLLESRDFNARLIEKYDLLPALYRYKWPKTYEKERDSTNGSWKKSFRQPDMLGMGGFLFGTFVKKTVKNEVMTIEVSSRDSALSFNLARHYLEFLDEDIKSSVRDDAKENVSFLEKQLVTISDPLLREKLQTLISDEIEKTMLVSKEAFKVVDPVFLRSSFKEKRIFPLAAGALMFFLTVTTVILGHAFSTAVTTEEDRKIIDRIKRELLHRK